MKMFAEDGDYTGAMSYVNKIRERAGMDQPTANSKEEAMKYIKRERRLELLGEGVRWFDDFIMQQLRWSRFHRKQGI